MKWIKASTLLPVDGSYYCRFYSAGHVVMKGMARIDDQKFQSEYDHSEIEYLDETESQPSQPGNIPPISDNWEQELIDQFGQPHQGYNDALVYFIKSLLKKQSAPQPEGKTAEEIAYQCYGEWCKENEYHLMSLKEFRFSYQQWLFKAMEAYKSSSHPAPIEGEVKEWIKQDAEKWFPMPEGIHPGDKSTFENFRRIRSEGAEAMLSHLQPQLTAKDKEIAELREVFRIESETCLTYKRLAEKYHALLNKDPNDNRSVATNPEQRTKAD